MLRLLKLKNKIPNNSGLATTAALTAKENEIPASSLVKKQIVKQK